MGGRKKDKRVLGIIPARGGSKRIKDKNLIGLFGKPLIYHSIKAALESNIGRLIVSTDSEKIAGTADKYGCEVPFIRPAGLAKDNTPDQPVLAHALKYLEKKENYKPDIVVHLRPTTPLKTAKIIDRVINKARTEDADIVKTVTEIIGEGHPYWCYRLDNKGKMKPFIDGVNMSEYYRRQTLPPVYRANGLVDAYKRDVVLNGNILECKNMTAVRTDSLVSVDIDTLEDLRYCEFLMQKAS